MRTKAFKKILSVVCVLALLASVCVVSFAGNASAATSYTFNNCGKITSVSLNEGDTLPTPEVVAPGANFLGWYDNYSFTGDAVTVAGTAKQLYAKYDVTALTFDDGYGVYDPYNQLKTSSNAHSKKFKIETNSDDATTKSLHFSMTNDAGRYNYCPMVTNAVGADGYKIQAGKTYEIYMKFKGSVTVCNVDMQAYGSAANGISNTGNKAGLTSKANCRIVKGDYSNWTSMCFYVTVPENFNVTAYPYLLLTFYQGNVVSGMSVNLYIDELIISEIANLEAKSYTLNDRGQVETVSVVPGAALPTISDRNFLGWSDATLTATYGCAPSLVTELYAKYENDLLNFEYKGYYDPNGKVGTANTTVAPSTDPTAEGNGANVVTDLVGNTKANNFALAGAEGASAGLKLNKGVVYQLKFDYYAAAIDTGVNVSVISQAKDAIGTDTTGYTVQALTSSNVDGSFTKYAITEASEGWESTKVRFTYDGTSVNQFLSLLVENASDGANSNNVVYFDNIEVKKYTAPNYEESAIVDFENNYEWSVAEANNYTETTGNGYVTRGAIVEFGEQGNHAFNMKHYQKKNGYIYFTFNTGDHQFKLSHGGVYVISFDYFVKHSETPTKLGLLRTKPTLSETGNQFTIIEEITSFDYRDDEAGFWTHYELTYFADLSSATEQNSLGIYLFNSTKCPEEYATDVYFDNVSVDVLSYTDDLGAIVFDSTGGTEVKSLALPSSMKAGPLPTPTRELYNFAGWRYDVEIGGETVVKVFNEKTVVNAGVTYLYAAWTPIDGAVEVIYRSNVPEYDKKHYSSVGLPGQAFLSVPVDPSCATDTFKGWYLDRNFTIPLDHDNAPTVSGYAYAKWESEGTLIDFENYPTSITSNTGPMSDRYEIYNDAGKHYLYYNLSKGTNQDTNSKARTIMYDGKKLYQLVEGSEYKITFKYKVLECKVAGTLSFFSASNNNGWGNPKEQEGAITISNTTNGWVEASITFVAQFYTAATNNDYLYIAFNGNSKTYVDDVVINSAVNEMNVYGTQIRFVTNGGKDLDPISGDVGDKLDLPTPVKPGYKFLGWFLDKNLTQAYSATEFGNTALKLYAKWQLGKFTEGFEDFPTSVKSLGVAGAYSFYNSKSSGFDATNIHGGETSLFRNGATAGTKGFTAMRTTDLALNVGSQYTLDFWVKPTSVTAADGTISILNMSTFTGISTGTVDGVIAKVADLKVGEWQHVSYTFTAKSEFIGITTTAGNDMYFDDITVTLAGYTGSSTGDSTVSPLLILAIVILSCGALIVTGKKVFSK